MKKTIVFAILALWTFAIQAQTIKMNFPAFEGKTYEFVLFLGGENIKAQRGTIPEDGKFELKVPKEYAPYTGMCRWLITNSAEGGGLDMAIPGKGYSISCMSDKPDQTNIVYEGYDPVNALNKIYNEQQKIIEKFELMSRAMQLYDKGSELYDVFKKEQEQQILAYDKFHQDLKQNPNYNARFLPIVNLTQGIPHKLTDDYEERAHLNAEYIANELNFDELYTSGHWSGILSSWVLLHTQALAKDSLILPHFTKMSARITDPKKYTDFVERITYYLNYYGQDNYISIIAPVVVNSGKITEYTDKLAVYQKVLTGMQAAPLRIVTKTNTGEKQMTTLPSSEFAQNGAQKTLLIFYQSGCGHCEELLGQLPGNYNNLKQKGYDIIAVSADEEEIVFENTARPFPWKRTYCDFEGTQGTNFTNYAVSGTPTIYVIDKQGKIENQMATLQQLLDYTKTK